MSLTSGELIRLEGKLVDEISDEILAPFVLLAEKEIRSVVDFIEFLIVDYAHFRAAEDANFLRTRARDSAANYGFSYQQIIYLANGYDNVSNTNYCDLITKIDTALSSANQEVLTDKDKLDLRLAGDAFRKAETLIALAYAIVPLGTRPTAKGGFVTQIGVHQGSQSIWTLKDLEKLQGFYEARARRVLFPYVQDMNTTGDNYPEWFEHPDFSFSIIPGLESTSKKYPRER